MSKQKSDDGKITRIRLHTNNNDPAANGEFKKQTGMLLGGLSQSEAEHRLAEHGYNELPVEKSNSLLKLFSYFWGPIPWMIEIASVLSVVVQHWTDFAIILVLLFLNAGVAFWEEYQAGNAIAALKAKLALKARVKRDGSWKSVPARELVSDDVIRLRLGDVVPADCVLMDSDPVEVDQSALTGESLPVTSSQGDTVYSGSVIRQGETDALVTATGQDTYFGKTAHLVETARTRSHFQKAVLKIGNFLIVTAIAMVIVILTAALFRGESLITTLQFALILTVAAIPVAMPAVLSVTMAIGARLLAAKQAIVSRLTAIEELAGMDVLCSDKTGTLTQNKLTLGKPFCINPVEPEEVILTAALASRAEDQDPIDLAVIDGLADASLVNNYKILHFQPFDPIHKKTEAKVSDASGHVFRTAKGAPQVILSLCKNAPKIRNEVKGSINEFASRGFRSLGVARTNGDDDWQFLGVLPLYDPPREDSKATVETAEKMRIKLKMVTGDQMAIGKEIARQLGLGAHIQDAGIFAQTEHHQTGLLADSIEKADGFAQVFPEHKYHIVDVLQQRGHIVGMTGDGVNDAPALKKADVGIAVSGSTDAARSAADIVLLSPGLSVIIDAIKESRKTFQRMNSYAIYRIAETIRVLLFMTLAILVFNFYPVTAAMIVLLAVLNDAPILTIALDEVNYSEKPERWDMSRVLGVATILGIMGVVASFGLFYLGERVFHLSQEMIQTLIFLKLAVAGHLTIFVTRTHGPFWSTRPGKSLLWTAFSTKMLATLAAVYGFFMVPIGWQWGLVVWGYSLVWLLINDRVKLASYKLFEPISTGNGTSSPA